MQAQFLVDSRNTLTFLLLSFRVTLFIFLFGFQIEMRRYETLTVLDWRLFLSGEKGYVRKEATTLHWSPLVCDPVALIVSVANSRGVQLPGVSSPVFVPRPSSGLGS